MGDLPVGAVRALERNEAARLCQLGSLSSPDPSVFSDRVSDPTISGIRSFLAGAGSGMYVPLRSRDGVIGLLVIEHASPNEDTDSSLRLLVSLSQTAASAIDNARWFARIRTIAADELLRWKLELARRSGKFVATAETVSTRPRIGVPITLPPPKPWPDHARDFMALGAASARTVAEALSTAAGKPAANC